MIKSGYRWRVSQGKQSGDPGAERHVKLVALFVLLLLCVMPLTAKAVPPEVAIIDGPGQGAEIEQGTAVGFTFTAAGGGSEVLPGRGPLIILAAGDTNPSLNSHWNATENMVKMVYNGFKNSMDYTDDDIFLIMGKTSIDINDDGMEDPDVIDHSRMTKTAVTDAMDSFARQAYQAGQTLYLWVVGHD